MKHGTIDVLLREATDEKVNSLDYAIDFVGCLFKKSRADFKLLYSADNNIEMNELVGESFKLKLSEIDEIISNSVASATNNKVLLFPRNNMLKRNQKLSISTDDNHLFNSAYPIFSYQKVNEFSSIKNIIAPINLEHDYMPEIIKLQKLLKSFKSATLHLVSVLQNVDDYKINRATQQLSFLNQLFLESGIKHTSEIIYSQDEIDSKSQIILDHINKVNADFVVNYASFYYDLDYSLQKEFFFELLYRSDVPIITFVKQLN